MTKRTSNLDNKARLKAVRRFATACCYEKGHSEQVTRLAEMLFDGLRPLHGLDETARFWLTCAGILHDIGWIDGQKGHHKQSMRMILDDRTLPLTPDERAAIALVARYHRKALPKPTHTVYADLPEDRKSVVDKLAAILRLADGLDRSHTDAVEEIEVTLEVEQIHLVCHTHGPAEDELHFGKTKADLLEQVFGRDVKLSKTLIKP